MWRFSISQCSSSVPQPTGTLTVVQSLYWAPGLAASVLRSTTWPVKGSCSFIQSKAASRFFSGRDHATRAPWASLVASSVWRTRRTTPASIMAFRRWMTTGTGWPHCSEMAWKGKRRKPLTRSSATIRMSVLTGSFGEEGMLFMTGQKKAGRWCRPARKAGVGLATARIGTAACCRTGRRKWRRIRGAGCGRRGRSAFRCAGVPVP